MAGLHRCLLIAALAVLFFCDAVAAAKTSKTRGKKNKIRSNKNKQTSSIPADETSVSNPPVCGDYDPKTVENAACEPAGLQCEWQETTTVGELTGVYEEYASTECVCSAKGKFTCTLSRWALGPPLLQANVCPTLNDVTYNEVVCYDKPLTCTYPNMKCACPKDGAMTCQ
jgi:hypothetical protein